MESRPTFTLPNYYLLVDILTFAAEPLIALAKLLLLNKRSRDFLTAHPEYFLDQVGATPTAERNVMFDCPFVTRAFSQ